MLDSRLLEALIATTVVLLVFSSITSIIVEALNNLNVRQKRQMYLYLSIRTALNDPRGINIGTLLYLHPQIRTLKARIDRYPAYLSASTFADTLMSVLREYAHTRRMRLPAQGSAINANLPPIDFSQLESYQNCLNEMPECAVQRLLISFTIVSTDEKDKLTAFRKNIMAWFDSYQDRVAGDYKKSIRIDLRWVGTMLALFFNFNIITVTTEIFSNKTLRDSLVGVAEKTVRDSVYRKQAFECRGCTEEEFERRYRLYIDRTLDRADSLGSELARMGLPVGWNLPRSSRLIRLDYLSNDIIELKKLKKDTVSRLKARYCLLKSTLNTMSHQQFFPLASAIMTCENVNQDSIVSIGNRFNATISLVQARTIAHFFNAVANAGEVRACLPDEPSRTSYGSCLTDCTDLDHADFVNDIIHRIDERIHGDELEIQLFDQWSIQEFFKHFHPVQFLVDVVRYNIRDIGGALMFILGAVLSGMLVSVGSNAWFEVLMRLFQIRNTGVRPKKGE